MCLQGSRAMTCLAHMAGAIYLWYDTVCCSLPRKTLALFWGLLLPPAEFNTAGAGLLPAPDGPHSLSTIDKKSFSHLDMHRPYGIGINYPEPHIKDFCPTEAACKNAGHFQAIGLWQGKFCSLLLSCRKDRGLRMSPRKQKKKSFSISSCYILLLWNVRYAFRCLRRFLSLLSKDKVSQESFSWQSQVMKRLLRHGPAISWQLVEAICDNEQRGLFSGL